MKTLTLIDVPKSRPSKRELLKAFKEKHNIQTLYTKGIECPWLACWMTRARKFGYGVTEASDLFDCISKVGRLLDEAGVCTYANTEREAIEELCRNNQIPFDL